jgi:hypothetical protein
MGIPKFNPWIFAAFAAAVGGAVGVAGSVVQSSLLPWRIGGYNSTVGGTVVVRETGAVGDREPAGQVEVSQTVHNFGTLGVGASGSHAFLIKNVGRDPLRLTRGSTSCTCTIAGFSADGPDDGEGAAREEDSLVKNLAPGESTRVVLEWKGRGSDGSFRQQATIHTSDPRRAEIVFVIEGNLVPTWKAAPESLLFSRLSATSGETATTRVFTYGMETPQLDSVTVDHPEAAERFRVESTPLAADEIAAENGATGGFLVTVEALPGLPLGLLRATLQMNARIPEPIGIELPIEGIVTGDLSLAGSAWDRGRQALLLGTVSGKVGLRTQMFLISRGPHREQVRPVVKEVEPPSLEVVVAESEPIGSGGVTRTPIEIIVAPGSPAANHLCTQVAPGGRIVLETGHPDVPTLTIPVCIAIGP